MRRVTERVHWRSVRQTFAVAAFCATLSGVASAAPWVVNKQARAGIVVPENASPQLREAALSLQRYIRESTGAVLPIRNTPGGNGEVTIHLGRSTYVDALPLKLDTLDGDGFVLKGIDNGNYVIAGPTDWGTEFGVYELLERCVGVRWLMPTDDGTHVPAHSSLDIPLTEVRQQPAYWSRQVSPFGTDLSNTKTVAGARNEWARRNRMHGRVGFHHNLLHLFPPSKYAKTHPEFYPIYNGKRYIPIDDEDPRWQPNFSAPGIVEEAVKNIKQYFRDNPGATSYSLGMNDSNRFDESPESLARENGKKNFLGDRDVSDSYFEWANAVVTEVLKEFPDKWFGTLAYNNIAEPPTRVKPHPRIIPYLTYDRMKWLDPEIEKQGKELTQRWAAVSPVIGWYDYVYGYSYLLPRVYPRQMQNYLKWGQDNKVQVHYAELYPNWGEGPKPWIFLKLQWNPSQNVDALLDDWYRHAVGDKAAPKLKEYYAIWERFWTQDAIKSRWFTKDGQYLAFYRANYLDDVKMQDVERARSLMNDVVRLAQTPAQKTRAAHLERAWQFYEASVQAYSADRLAREANVKSEADALALLNRVDLIDAASRRLRLLEESRRADNPNSRIDYIMLEIDQYPALRGESWGAGLLWRVMPWIKESPVVRERVEQIAKGTNQIAATQAKLILDIADGKGRLVSANPSFEEGLQGWSTWLTYPDQGKYSISTDRFSAGRQSLLVEGIKRGGPHLDVPFEPGRYYATAKVFVPQGQNAANNATLVVQARDKDDKMSGTRYPLPSTPIHLKPGEWNVIGVPFEMKPDDKVKNVQLVVTLDSFAPGEKVYLDEVGIYKLP